MSRGQKYTQEFKESTIQLVLSSEKPARQIAKELGINEKTLYGWLKDYREKNNIQTSKKTSTESIEEENRRLRRENALLKKEREILKKAAAYFAKETM